MSVLRPAPRVAVLKQDDVIYVAKLPDGPILVLEGGAAAIWIEACRGERSSIAERLTDGTGVPAGDIRANVEKFIDEMLRSGLLAVDSGDHRAAQLRY